MATVLHAYVSIGGGTRPTFSVWTTPEGRRMGLPDVNSIVPLPDDWFAEGPLDATEQAALSIANLGSKLLRLASEIRRQPALLHVDLP
jgi:hypothetical protein